MVVYFEQMLNELPLMNCCIIVWVGIALYFFKVIDGNKKEHKQTCGKTESSSIMLMIKMH